MAGEELNTFGNEEQKKKFLPGLATGERLATAAVTEATGGSDPTGIRTTYRKDGDDFIVNGQKIWTTTAHLAEMMFALIRTEAGASKHAGLSYILIPMDTPGIEVRPIKMISGESE